MNKKSPIEWTEEMDEAVKEIYSIHYPSRHRTNPSTSALDVLEKHPLIAGIPRRPIAVHARKLGLVEPREPDWSKEELQYLLDQIGTYRSKTIWQNFRRRGFNRSLTAIELRIKRFGYSRKADLYSALEVAQALGMDSKTCLKQIFEKKLIKFSRDGKQNLNDGYYVKPRDLAVFIRQHPYVVNRYRPFIPFVVALLDEYRPTKVAWDEKEREFLTGKRKSRKEIT